MQEHTDLDSAPQPSKFRIHWVRIAVAIAILVVIVIVGALAFRRPTDSATSVVANGSVEATEIVLSAKVPGRLSAVNVDEGQTVALGAVVARIDSDDVLAQARAADAQVAAASAQVVSASINVTQVRRQSAEATLMQAYAGATTTATVAQALEAVATAQHGVHAANAALIKSRDDLARMSSLYRSGAISAMQYDAYRTAYEGASAQDEQARHALGQAQAAAGQAQAGNYQLAIRSEDVAAANDQIRNAQAALDIARAQLALARAQRAQVTAAQADTILRAPTSGTVLRVIAHAGEVVAAGAPVLTMADLGKLYVRVYVSEQDVASIRVGDSAAVTVDAYPDHAFHGRVASVDQEAQFTPTTVHMPDERTRLVYGVRIALDDSHGFLKPGMLADTRLTLVRPSP